VVPRQGATLRGPVTADCRSRRRAFVTRPPRVRATPDDSGIVRLPLDLISVSRENALHNCLMAASC
jgi:hypothetical protein